MTTHQSSAPGFDQHADYKARCSEYMLHTHRVTTVDSGAVEGGTFREPSARAVPEWQKHQGRVGHSPMPTEDEYPPLTLRFGLIAIVIVAIVAAVSMVFPWGFA